MWQAVQFLPLKRYAQWVGYCFEGRYEWAEVSSDDIKSHLLLQMSGQDCKLSGNMCFLYRTTWAKASPQVFPQLPHAPATPQGPRKAKDQWGLQPPTPEASGPDLHDRPKGIWKVCFCISFPSSHPSHPCEKVQSRAYKPLTRAREKGAQSPITWVKMVSMASVWQPPVSLQQLQAHLSPLAGESESAEARQPLQSPWHPRP